MCAATTILRQSSRQKASHRPQVPVFSLYGEADAIPPEFIHIEDIRSRSERYEWEIAEHRHNGLFQLLLLIEGGAQLRIEHGVEDVRAPFAVAIPSGIAHAFRFAPGTRGFVLTIEEVMLARRSARVGGPQALLAQPALVDLSEAPEQAARLIALMEQIALEFRDGGRATGAVLQWLASTVLVLLLRQTETNARQQIGGAREATEFHRFRGLVETHYKDHWPITRYASSLGVSESRLSRLCHAVAGRPPLQVVQDRIVIEARRRLRHVAGSVSMLAYELGFEDPAYFWRFFRRNTGMTPTEFRQLNGRE